MERFAVWCLVPVLAAGHAASAQFPVESKFVADTELRCEASTFFMRSTATLPRSSDLGAGAVVTATRGSVATVRVTQVVSPRGLTATVHEEASAAGPYGSAIVGEHDTLLRLLTPVPTRVRLVVTSSSSGNDTERGGYARSALVDVGDDATPELTGHSGRFERIVTLGPNALPIRTRTQLSAGTSDTTLGVQARGTVTIQVLPPASLVVVHEAATDVTARIELNTNVLPARSLLTPAVTVATSSGDLAASFTSSLTETPDRVALRITERGTPTVVPEWRAATGPHETVLTLATDPPRSLRLDLGGTATTGAPGTSFYVGEIDVGDDGSFELRTIPGETVSISRDVVVPAGGLRIRTRSSGCTSSGAPGRAAFAGELTIAVLPRLRCTTTVLGTPCGATSPQLRATGGLANRVELDLTQAPAGALGKTILGVTPVEWPLPHSRCTLLVAPLAMGTFLADGRGQALHELIVPAGVPATFVVQDVLVAPVGPLWELVATNAVRIDCQ